MKTLDAIIEKEIRNRIDDLTICQELITVASQDPQSYDKVIQRASAIAEDILILNFEYIIRLAALEDDEEESEDEPEVSAEKIYNISAEDEDMLKFIES